MCNTGFFLQKPFTFRNSFAQKYKKTFRKRNRIRRTKRVSWRYACFLID
ncbi:hypothetical protein LBBP_03397 [Leptospira borgpetersenii serovar Ballum]|uniref:Uncharacterized protein n=1 Tax=Leptospira borgpetersenii serovar Ballum TaxID=280505 RepID=A0A0S2IVC3_LEPBO|nr:hypothetical protein LBBP_03397 [Leptospira borgpetersenii serovar Ballum]